LDKPPGGETDMQKKKINVALAGMRFGGAFVPIYAKHPDVGSLTIIDTDEKALNSVGDKFRIKNRAASLDEITGDDSIDAVHLVTPIPLHAEQTLKVLNSGKHCACTVPAATSIKDLKAIVKAQKNAGKNYMMMETAVYTRQFMHVSQLQEESGVFGGIQLLRGCHYQDMEHWPQYWMGLPPMWYSTHAISPLLAFAGTRAVKVHCFGSGEMREELKKHYGNPYPVETAIFRLEGTAAAMEVTRSLFHTAREYTEGFCVYGEKATIEWNFEWEKPWLQKKVKWDGKSRGEPVSAQQLEAPDFSGILPPEIGRFTHPGTYDDTNPQLSFTTGGGHHGSHPHLVHEFVRSIMENRKPRIDSVTAADWTAAGICAHQSAMKDGALVEIPSFG
jgi:predicted dehydrogenase